MGMKADIKSCKLSRQELLPNSKHSCEVSSRRNADSSFFSHQPAKLPRKELWPCENCTEICMAQAFP